VSPPGGDVRDTARGHPANVCALSRAAAARALGATGCARSATGRGGRR
jgi:hypothetical protein